MSDVGIVITRTGAQMTVQDLGRPGFAHMGVTRSGAADVPAHCRANALVGNATSAATLEVTNGGCELAAHQDLLVAVTGATGPLWVGSVPAPLSAPFRVRAGQTLALGEPRHGLRQYIAVRGGIDVAPVLGSRATDILSGLGPDPVRDGQRLTIGAATPVDQAGFDELRRLAALPPATTTLAPDKELSAHNVTAPAPSSLSGTGAVTETDGMRNLGTVIHVRVHLGPRDDWFTPAAIETLLTSRYDITADTNRVGARLVGPALDRANPSELESEGLVVGAVQVPASGQPVIFLADHPVTGGYPVIAVVEPDDLPRVAQARPGDTVRFSAVNRPEA